VPLTALWIMPFGLAALALMPFGLAAFALLPMGWGIAVIVWLTMRISAWPDALLRIAPMPDAAILWFAAGLAWLCLLRSRIRIAGLAPMLLGAGLYASARPPDVLIAPDARLIAIRSPPQILLLREPRAESYTLAAWGPVWRGALLRRLDPADPPAGVACDSDGCTLARVYIALAQPQAGCPAAALVVSPVPLRGACDASGRVVIDRFSVWRDGAIAIWLGPDGAKTLSDRRVQGSRPWVLPWPGRRWDTTLD